MTGSIHGAAAGFGSAADAYERGRPSYPPEAVAFLIDMLDLASGSVVVDLGAGTGKLTRMIAPSGAHVVAVEPVEAMQAKLVQQVPSARAVRATAEALPLRDGSADAVVVAQAFHWFGGEAALAEIHRVLRPGGRLGLIWNVRDESVRWIAGMTEIIEPHRGDTPTHRSGAWREAFSSTDGFTPLELREFRHEQRLSIEGAVDRVTSVSFIATLPDGERAEVVHRIRDLLAGDPDTAGRTEVVLPYRTDVYWCERR